MVQSPRGRSALSASRNLRWDSSASVSGAGAEAATGRGGAGAGAGAGGRVGAAGPGATAMVREGVTAGGRVWQPTPAMAMTTRGPHDVETVDMNTPRRLMDAHGDCTWQQFEVKLYDDEST